MDISYYEVILTDVAKEELDDIYEYISNELKAIKVANQLMDKIERSILILERNPYLYPKVKIRPHNEIYRKLVIENYVVLYDVDEKMKQVIIYRVLYARRNYLKFES